MPPAPRFRRAPALAALLLASTWACTPAGTGPAPAPDPSRAADPVPAGGALPNLIGARAIVITDRWTGYSPVSPVEAAYRIERVEETWRFAGTARFTVGRRSGAALDSTVRVALPETGAQSFLQALTAVPVRAGHYQPTLTHTDDYPEITILLEFGDGAVEFYTRSQGEGHVPWRVTLRSREGERALVSDSDAPARALRALDPYLFRDVLNEMTREAARGSGDR